MGVVKYWDGEDFTILDSKDAQSVNGIKFRINVDILEYSNDGLIWEVIATLKDLENKGGGTKIITSATEPTLNVGDQWHKEI